MNQRTVVKLLPTDYHAARIMRGDTGRVCSEPGTPAASPHEQQTEAFPHGADAGIGSPYSDYQGSTSPSFNMAPQSDSQWGYITSPSYVAGEAYQPVATNMTLPPTSPVTYQMTPTPNHGFLPQVATSPHRSASQPVSYQAVASPTSPLEQPSATHYQYGAPVAYYPSVPAYDMGPPAYSGYTQPAMKNSGHAFPPGYTEPWLADTAQAPRMAQLAQFASDRPAVVLEQRKIVILKLEREGLSEAVVTNLVVEHTGIGLTPGEIERVELPINKDGRARGNAFVTFSAAELAAAAISALDGREVGGKALSVRLAEGVPPGQVNSVDRPGRRVGGKAMGQKGEPGKSSRTFQAQTQSQSRRSGSGSGSGSKSAGAVPQSGYTVPSGAASASSSVGSSGTQKKKREEPPVIVDGSGSRFLKKNQAPLVVDGSGASKKGSGGHRASRH